MAISIISQPNEIVPAGNPITYVFESDKTTEFSFGFKVQVLQLINGVYFAQLSESIIYPERSNKAHIDISEYVMRILSPTTIDESALYKKNNSTAEINIVVTERYGYPIVEDHDFVYAIPIKVFNGRLSPQEWEQTYFPDFVNYQWLTDMPINPNDGNIDMEIARRNGAVPLSMIVEGQFGIYLNAYDLNGDLYVNEFIQVQDNTFTIVDLNLNMYTLMDYNIDVFNTSYIEVQINDSQLARIHYADDCYDIRASLVFMNQYGVFDSYTFRHNITGSTDIKTRSYEKVYGQWQGDDFVYNHIDSGNTDYLRIMEDKGEISTKYMENEWADWLTSTVLESPYVLLYRGVGLDARIIVTDASYTNRLNQERFQDDLANVVIKFNRNNKRYSVNL